MVLAELKNISKDFGGITALKEIDMVVRQGGIHGLIGPNGAGKTTLFNIISGNYDATGGDLLFEGNSILKLRNDERVGLGIVRTFQNIRLFPSFSVLDHVKMGFHRRASANWLSSILWLNNTKKEESWIEEESRHLLKKVGLESFAQQQAKNLSYGNQRRLEIARALAAKPKLLLLDEPAAGLNESEVRTLLEQIREIHAEGITIILVEHDMNLVMEVSDQITVLSHGQKIAEGSANEIRNNPIVIREYLGTGKIEC